MTKPIKVISRWERIKRSTVWHPINTDPADNYRHGPRFWYPSFDFLMVGLGVYAFFIGSPLLNSLFPSWFVDGLGVAITVAALFACFGAVFPRFYYIELIGKLGLVFLLGGYAGTVAALSRVSEPNGFVVITLFSLVWLLGPRLSWLFLRLGKALNERKAARQATKAGA
ncbi:membrane protein [Microbacterium phage Ixel]|nr:membrane protein [Microbacterium phage Ixel]